MVGRSDREWRFGPHCPRDGIRPGGANRKFEGNHLMKQATWALSAALLVSAGCFGAALAADDAAMMAKPMTDKAMPEKAMTGKMMPDKAMPGPAMMAKPMADKVMPDKAMTDKAMPGGMAK